MLPLSVALAVLILALAIYFVALGAEALYSKTPIYTAIVVCRDKQSYQALMQSAMWSYVLGGSHKVRVLEDAKAVDEISRVIGLEVEGAVTIILENKDYKHVALGVVSSFNPSELIRELRDWPPSLIVSGERIRELSLKDLEEIRHIISKILTS